MAEFISLEGWNSVELMAYLFSKPTDRDKVINFVKERIHKEKEND